MLPLRQIGPSEEVLLRLRSWQDEIDAESDYSAQVASAQGAWRIHRVDPLMKEVEQLLEQMCCGGRRCAYCEDSLAREIEHIWPKSLYPELAFQWPNYLYACDSCNSKKGAQFAIFPAGGGPMLKVSRARGSVARVRPAVGDSVFVNPRCEDPAAFFTLDLTGSFKFRAHRGLAGRDRERAEYTLTALPLNSDPLLKQRRNAYRHYLSTLHHYLRDVEHHASPHELARHGQAIAESDHQTVWSEMKRQQTKIPELADLFRQAPEALCWGW